MLNFALVGEQQSRVCDLSGFRRSHRVPDEVSARANDFVRRIASDDIGEDLDQWFAGLRRELRLKRAQMKVSDPYRGSGTIITPTFKYQVSVGLSEDDPSLVTWQRRVSEFAALEAVLRDGFSSTFGTIFDTLEFAPVEPIDVEEFIDWIEGKADSQLEPDYDRTATWCCLIAPQQMASTMLIEAQLVSLKSLSPCPPGTLVKSFMAFRELLPAITWAS